MTAAAAMIVACVCTSQAATEKILHNFSILPHGSNPASALIADPAGNFYGVTSKGGAYGTVFQLTQTSDGKWIETVVHSFLGPPSGGTDGAYPRGGLVFDSAGSLYGATASGGIYGSGTIFKLTPSSGGHWKEVVIHNFADFPNDGARPTGNLIFDASGSLYGTTAGGGNEVLCGDQYVQAACGTVFELSPDSSGNWKVTILYNFKGGTDGCDPNPGLVFDKAGSLYGTTYLTGGSDYNCWGGSGGIAFKLSPGSGGWTEDIVFSFNVTSDGNPSVGLILDDSGNLYGATQYGGDCNLCGAVFELSLVGGSWIRTVLYGFSGGADGGLPIGNLSFDSSGNLYGSTEFGDNLSACGNGCGTVFELKPHAGTWAETTLYSFTGARDGSNPVGGVLLDSNGSLYIPTFSGGNPGCTYYLPGCGTVIRLKRSGGNWNAGVLYDFPSPSDGSSPQANLISDTSGNLYGTTEYGGVGPCGNGSYQGCGTIFELSPTSNGQWKMKVLYRFTGTSGDGANPTSTLTFDLNGNLYGTTKAGGATNCNGNSPCGTVFKLSLSHKDTWKETVIYEFSGHDSYSPMAGLVIDDQGALYGTAAVGGDADGGDVFQLVQHHGGVWHENIILRFPQQQMPQGGLVLDMKGNLYGTTRFGGGSQHGAVFRLSHTGSGWKGTILHAFNGTDGWWPMSSLTVDRDGSLYGTTWMGGKYNGGVVFKLTPGSGDVWTESVLHNFPGASGDGAHPASSVVFDEFGNLYGTTTVGGTNGGNCNGLGCGTAFELTPSNGEWRERVLHRFTGGLDGNQRYGGFILDPSGNLCGTTSSGGAAAQGTVFEIRP